MQNAKSISARANCKFYGIEWKMPFYQQEAKIIKLPTKEKLIMLISSAQKPLFIKLQISMEAELRPVELVRLKAKDIDSARAIKTVGISSRTLFYDDLTKSRLIGAIMAVLRAGLMVVWMLEQFAGVTKPKRDQKSPYSV